MLRKFLVFLHIANGSHRYVSTGTYEVFTKDGIGVLHGYACNTPAGHQRVALEYRSTCQECGYSIQQRHYL